ncbi:MAG TPA: DKNYY domain-containing protein [Candidatus Paceibacterota bacterium]|nr:DKNYY domain-containing protein [Candidatus Paceibacterota bacterium]
MPPQLEQQSPTPPLHGVPAPHKSKSLMIAIAGLVIIVLVVFAVWIKYSYFSSDTSNTLSHSITQNVNPAPCYVVQNGKVFLTLGGNFVSATSSYMVLGADPSSFTPITSSPLTVFGIEGAQVSGSVCYGKDASHVFFGRNAITGADLNSFQILSTNPRFAKDSTYVYRDGMRLFVNIDATSFKMLDRMYGEDAHTIYFDDISNPNYEGFLPLAGADPATFASVGDYYAKDKNTVYDYGSAIQGADVQTFSDIGCYYAKDSHAVYQYGQIINGASPVDFTVPTSTTSCDTSSGSRNAVQWTYTYANMPTNVGIDPSTFEPLSAMYAKDAEHVYFVEQNVVPTPIVRPIAGADPKTFQVLGDNPFGGNNIGLLSGTYSGVMAKDSSHVYYEGKIVAGADPSTFVWLNPIYGKDASHIYMVGPVHEDTTMLPISSDVVNFWGDPDGYFAEDSNSIYFEGSPIVGVDKSTFVIQRTFPYWYGVDAKNVYYIGYQTGIISGADPASFVVIDDSNNSAKYEAQDKNHFYYDKQIVK